MFQRKILHEKSSYYFFMRISVFFCFFKEILEELLEGFRSFILETNKQSLTQCIYRFKKDEFAGLKIHQLYKIVKSFQNVVSRIGI